jgi:hypothetical protein
MAKNPPNLMKIQMYMYSRNSMNSKEDKLKELHTYTYNQTVKSQRDSLVNDLFAVEKNVLSAFGG